MKSDGNGQSLLDVPEEAVLEVSDDEVYGKELLLSINDVQAKNIRYRITKPIVIGVSID